MKKSSDVKYSYRSGYVPTIVVEFAGYEQSMGFSRDRVKSMTFSGSQKENRREKWIEWGNFGMNFYFTTNKGHSWKDSIKYAKSWITKNLKDKGITSVRVEWDYNPRYGTPGMLGY